MKKLRYFIYVFLIIIICLYVASNFFNFQSPIKQIENLIGKTIPNNVVNVQSQFDGGIQGSSFFVQFDLPAGNFVNFIKEFCNTKEVELDSDYNAYARPRLSTWPDWWLPDSTQITISGLCIPNRGVDLEIFVDENNTELYKIYMRGGTA